MKDVEGQPVIASHKVGFLDRLEITDEGIRYKKFNIPHSQIGECSIYRSLRGVPKNGGITYTDQSGKHKHLQFGGMVIEVCSDIIRIAKQCGHTISWQQSTEIVLVANRLKGLGVESEFIQPSVEYNKQSSKFWHLDMGGLKLRGANADMVKVREHGSTHLGMAGGQTWETKVDIQFHIDVILQIECTRETACRGDVVKRFPRRVVDYQWVGKEFARRLNEDAQLCKMLVKVKAPPMRVEENHILIQGKRLPSLELFRCIDRIAGHIRQEASQ